MKLILTVCFLFFTFTNTVFANDKIIAELDEAWGRMATAVAEGEFEKYIAAYHPDAVFVNKMSNNSSPMSKPFNDWKQGFIDTKAGKVTANVSFRFSQRLHDETTAHETGIFYYYVIDGEGKRSNFIIHMNALLVKKSGEWLMLMEYQKSKATEEEWEALK